MILYQFPKPKSAVQRNIDLLNEINEKKRLKKSLYKNLAVGLIIIALSVKVTVIPLLILVYLVGLISILFGVYVYYIGVMIYDKKVFTKIYDEHIIHTQRDFFGLKYTEIKIFFNDVLQTKQLNNGDLVFTMKESSGGYVKTSTNKGEIKVTSPMGKVQMNFLNSEPKYFLIKGIGYRLNYKD